MASLSVLRALALLLFSALPTAAYSEFSAAQIAVLKQVGLSHGVLGVLTWVVLAPASVVVLRTLQGRTAVWAHGLIMAFTYIMFTGCVGTGIWLANSSGRLVGHHTIIGLLIYVVASFQAIGGVVAHLLFKKHKRPTAVGTFHAFNGIFLITLGMINGGLGLLYAHAPITSSEKIVYGVITAMIWICFMAFAIITRNKRSKVLKGEKMRSENGTTGSSTRVEMDSNKELRV